MRLALLFLLIVTSGCSTRVLDTARLYYHSGRLPEAAASLADCEGIIEKDRLLCLMEQGTIAFTMQDHEKSTDTFLQAAQLMKKQDQISILGQTSAIIINDQTTEYKGEYAERLWIHTYLMMNFLLQDKYESGLVEAKQALEVIDRYPKALRYDYFSRALIALCYENMAKFDDATIEYKNLAALSGTKEITPYLPSGDMFEAVLFISQGRIPYKTARDMVLPPSIRISVPEYHDYQLARPLRITSGSSSAYINITTDLGLVVKQSLQDRVAEYATRQAIRVGTKEALAQAAGQQDALAEALVRIVLFIAEQADTRSWQTLPGGLTLARLYLTPGSHSIAIDDGAGRSIKLNLTGIKGMRLFVSVDL